MDVKGYIHINFSKIETRVYNNEKEIDIVESDDALNHYLINVYPFQMEKKKIVGDRRHCFWIA